jgi:hypothetical protein
MRELWVKLLGADRLAGGDVERWTVHWNRLQTHFQVFLFLLAFAAAIYGIWWFYRREPAYCARRRKVFLAAFRALGLLILLIILAGPVLEIVKSGTVRGKVVVLVDVSESMGRVDKFVSDRERLAAAHVLGLAPLQGNEPRALPARADETLAKATRLDLVRGLLKHPRIRLLERLRREYDVEVWSFARAADLEHLSLTRAVDGAVLDGLRADGVATEIGGVLRATAARLKGQPLSGAVLITDGGNNRGEEPALAAEDFPARIFPVGVGVPETKDVAVAHFFMESRIFLDDRAPIYVRLRHHGFAGSSCQITVSVGGEELARQSVTLKSSGEQTEVVRVQPKRVGKFMVRVEVPLLPGDGEAGNNFKEREVEVIDKKIRVLLAEGEPRWEFRYLFTALQRDKRVECKAVLGVPDLPQLAVAGGPFLKSFPPKEELFKYDVVVFGNLPNDAFWTEQDLENLRQFVVSEGGGLWMIAGRNHFPDTYKDSKLELLIPVEFERNAESSVEDEMHGAAGEGFRAVVTPEGKLHNLMRLDAGTGSEEENAGLWELLPDLYWHHKAVRPKLGATVLLAHGGRRGAPPAAREGPPPLLVTAQVGRGRVLYSAIEEFWRMRFPIELGPDALDRFHAHAVQFLGLGHCLGGTPRIEISTDREEYGVGDRVRISARILNRGTYDPSTAERIAALSSDLENEARVAAFELTPMPGQPGIFRGELAAPDPGHYRITLKEEEEEGAYKDYAVHVPQLELESPEMKKELLEHIAQASRSGPAARARMYLPDEAGAIPEELKAGQRRLEYRIEDPLWDAPVMLGLFVLFLGVEWLVRKRSDLC